MRPLRLEVEAMGPFATHQVVDFDDLSDEGLFLIWGPTGAGKSFLLDAVCYALYGRTAGDRPLPHLHSDHARDAVPRVELRFRLGVEEWCVRREAPRWRTKRDGTAAQASSKAVLERIVPGGVDVVATKVTEVDRILRERLGLDVNDFRRVVLLPQGRFEKVLHASAQEREDLLQSIFGTSVFEEVAGELDHRARLSARALDEAEADQRRRADAAVDELHRLRSELAPLTDLLGPVLDLPSLLPEERSRPGADDGRAPTSQDDLDRWAAALRQGASRLTEAEAEADAALEAARREAEALRALAAGWDRRQELRVRAGVLAGEEQAVAGVRTELEAAERAARVIPALGAARDARRRIDEARADRRRAAVAVVEAWSTCPVTLPAPLDGAPREADDVASVDGGWLRRASAAVARRAGEVEAAAESARRARAGEEAASEARASVARHGAEAERWAATAADATERLQAARARLATSEEAAVRVDSLAATVERLAGWVAAARRHPAAADAVREAQDGRARRANAEADARLHLAELRRLHLDGIAAELAATLTEGTPCPVCGGCDHPEPAAPTAGTPGRPELEEAEQAAEEAALRREEAEEALAEAVRREAEVRGRAGDAADDPAGVEAELAARRAELEEVGRDAGLVEERRDRVADLAATASAAGERAEAARLEAARVEASLAALDTHAREAAAEAAAVLGTGTTAEVAVLATAALTRLSRALDGLDEADGRLARATSAGEEAARALTSALAEAGFDDAAAAHAAARPPDERARLRRRVERWETARQEVAAALRDGSLADLPDLRPDPGPAAAAAGAAHDLARGLAEARVRVASAAAVLREVAAAHREDGERLAVGRAEHEVHRRLAELCTGRGGDRISLHRWVLASHFELICERANARLAVMTGGRYSLRVHSGSQRGRGAGLDLRVLDAHSGEERDVTTLSGGESFQASLSLALGVADVVAERSGGIDLDVLFIDEGFGTLDADALQLALDELDRLRAGGRMVGVISHVAGLRERIGAGIEVRPGRGGSTVRVGAAPVG